MKKCLQCGQTLDNDTKFCFKCGGSNFEQVAEGGSNQQQAAPVYQQQPVYQQPSYQQPNYQQPMYQGYDNTKPARIKDFLIFYLLMLIPIFNLVYLIIVAVGGPKHNVSLTNYCRATLIWAAIILVLYILLIVAFGSVLMNMFSGYYSYY